jgi:hypothetical protein
MAVSLILMFYLLIERLNFWTILIVVKKVIILVKLAISYWFIPLFDKIKLPEGYSINP